MEEEGVEEIIINNYNLKKKKVAEEFLDLSELSQRLIYDSKNTSHTYTRIWKNEEKTVIQEIHRSVKKFPNKKAFLKKKIIGSITYKHKGPTNSRLKIWRGTSEYLAFELFNIYINKELPELKGMIDSSIFENIRTKGMMSKILAGKITTLDECVKYFITYTIRPITKSITTKDSKDIIYLLSHTGKYQVIDIMRSSISIKSFIKQIKEIDPKKEDLSKFLGNLSVKILNLNRCNFKIDWSVTGIKDENLGQKLSAKVKQTEDMFNLWDGGPVFEGSVKLKKENKLSF